MITVLATAIPRITDEFGTIDDIGWYGSAYFLTICSECEGTIYCDSELTAI